jgi:hypothetical protein
MEWSAAIRHRTDTVPKQPTRCGASSSRVPRASARSIGSRHARPKRCNVCGVRRPKLQLEERARGRREAARITVAGWRGSTRQLSQLQILAQVRMGAVASQLPSGLFCAAAPRALVIDMHESTIGVPATRSTRRRARDQLRPSVGSMQYCGGTRSTWRPRVRRNRSHACVRIWASGLLPPLATVVRRPELRSIRLASKAHGLELESVMAASRGHGPGHDPPPVLPLPAPPAARRPAKAARSPRRTKPPPARSASTNRASAPSSAPS